ncbi:MAG TPA: phytanoyl-CoA dioxygenase family protein [Verrucomicrobiae bacterium]|nr:phytanoyl-CoA dioxygenase family protein [Verrucomicrobiae bacterium]
MVPTVLDAKVVNDLLALMQDAQLGGGRRNVLADFAEVQSAAHSPEVRSIVESILGPDAFAVRGLFFDKNPQANWMVGWHQDRTIAVRERHETPGFTLWTIKSGVHHVQPPVSILKEMLTIRLHLDETDESNGPLRVIPGSHHAGLIPEEDAEIWVNRCNPVICSVERGGAVVMRPLLLHASSKATNPSHRRVLHIEFASQPLPGKLNWAFKA